MAKSRALALSIRQPWAWLIANGIKDIENRTWNTNYRGQFLIHAAQTFDKEGYEWVCDHFEIELPRPEDFERGGIVGVVELVEVVTQHNSAWFEGPYGLVLEQARPIKFIPKRGQLGFFEVSLEDTQENLD